MYAAYKVRTCYNPMIGWDDQLTNPNGIWNDGNAKEIGTHTCDSRMQTFSSRGFGFVSAAADSTRERARK
jgi:hypothetical protein